ncbi:MAG: hypothetical protein MUF01_13410 [Bryobacterales bacterium]|nr:hypothetical protein [Bryobacterales bacterium]
MRLRFVEWAIAVSLGVSIAAVLTSCGARKPEHADWRYYGGNETNSRYSALDQIHRGNVASLGLAWTYDTGDAFKDSEMQCNPLVVDGVLYGLSPKMRVFALDASTGKELWSFDHYQGKFRPGKKRSRGLHYWQDGSSKRILIAVEEWLYALDAASGQPILSFGHQGRINLKEGLGRDFDTFTISVSSPGVIFKDKLMVGSIVSEGLPACPGDIRDYDVRSG